MVYRLSLPLSCALSSFRKVISPVNPFGTINKVVRQELGALVMYTLTAVAASTNTVSPMSLFAPRDMSMASQSGGQATGADSM